MKHYSDEEWIDFMNQVTPQARYEEMQKHVASGCAGCTRQAAIWQRVHQMASMEAGYQPDADTLRVVKSAFAAHSARKESGRVAQLFDSLLQPAFAGARSMGSESRQLLYSAGPYLLDVQIKPKSTGNGIEVTGQLLHSEQPEQAVRDALVLFFSGDEEVTLAMTNQFGEFRGELENCEDLELHLPVPQGEPLVVPLRDLMSGRGGEAR
ncbi:MAG: hypothetical protein ACRD50_14020 [Candidatus Acidiferrales bacterium]